MCVEEARKIVLHVSEGVRNLDSEEKQADAPPTALCV